MSSILRYFAGSLLFIALYSHGQADVSTDFGLTHSSATIAPNQDNRRTFNGAPVQAKVTVGQETQFMFFESVSRVAIKPQDQQRVRFESFGSNLMLIIDAPLVTRIKVQTKSNLIVPLDITSEAGRGHLTSYAIDLPVSEQVEGSSAINRSLIQHSRVRGQNQIELIRAAMREFYAPPRLRDDSLAPFEVSVEQNPLQLYRTGQVVVQLLRQWRQNEVYITAYKVTNRINRAVELDPRRLRGRLILASFYHAQLDARGQPGDETLLVTISDYPPQNNVYGGTR